MKFRDGLRLANRDLGRRKGRTFLTAFAVAVGTMLIVTLVSLGTSGESLILDKVKDSPALKEIQVMNMKYVDVDDSDSSDINSNDMFKKISNNTVEKFKNIKGVDEIKATIAPSVTMVKIDGKQSKDDTLVEGVYNNDKFYSKDKLSSVRKDNKNSSLKPIIYGRNLEESDKDGVLVSEGYLKDMGINDYKDMLGKDITFTETKTENQNIKIAPYSTNGKIVGIIDDRFIDKNTIVAALDITDKIQSYYSLQDNYLKNFGYDSVMIYSKDVDSANDVADAVKNMGYMNYSYYQEVESIKGAFKIIKVILAVLGLIVLFVAAVGTVNTMTMVIYERTKSIGIMKSIGASRTNIHSVFMMQAAVIGFMGGIMGLVFSTINVNIIQFALKIFLQSKKVTQTVNITMPFWLILGSLAFSVVICIIAGVYPSRKASKMDPVQALNS